MGLKAAAQNWQKKVQEKMASRGSSIGRAARSVLSSPEKFEMSGARRRLSFLRRTSGSYLDAKRVGVQAGNQHHNT